MKTLERKNKNFWRLALRLFVCYVIAGVLSFIAFAFDAIVLDGFFEDYILVMIVIGVAACALSSIVVIMNYKKSENAFLREVDRALVAAESGDFTVKVTTVKNESFDEIADGLNMLMAQLDSAEVLKSGFIESFSLKFGKPVDSLKCLSERLISGDITLNERKSVCGEIYSESRALSELVDKAMLLSKLESEHISDKRSFYLNEQIECQAVKFYKQVERKKLDVDVDLPPIVIAAQEEFIDELWQILFSAIIDGAENGDKISVKSCKTKNGIKVVFTFGKANFGEFDLKIIKRITELDSIVCNFSENDGKTIFEFLCG